MGCGEGGVDVIVGDRRIIGSFGAIGAGQVDVTRPVTTYELFADPVTC